MRYLIAASCLLAIVACGGSSDAGSPDRGSSNDATEASASPSTEDTASVQQYASIIARKHPEYLAKMENCDWLGTGDLDGGAAVMTCQIGLLSLSFEAKILNSSLVGASKEGVPAYIGAVPDEIADLVDETVVASRALGSAAAKADRAG